MTQRDDSYTAAEALAAEFKMVVMMLEVHADSLEHLGHDVGAGRLRLLVRDLKAGMA